MRSGGFVSNTVGKVVVDTRYDGQIRKSMTRLFDGKAIALLLQDGAYQIHSLRVSSDGDVPSGMRN